MTKTLISQEKPFAPVPVPRPLWFTVQGRDFGRSIAWAKTQPNTVDEQITAAVKRLRGDVIAALSTGQPITSGCCSAAAIPRHP
jgi:hypothetical protein